jgi:hypothetical protein
MRDPIYRAAGIVTQRHVRILTPPADLSARMTRAIAGGGRLPISPPPGHRPSPGDICPNRTKRDSGERSETRQMKRGVELSDEAEREIEATFQAARNNLGAAASIFMTGDPRAARELIEQKRQFRRREADAIRAHLAQLRASNGRQALPLDLLRDIKRPRPIRCWRRAAPCLRAGFRTDRPEPISLEGRERR